MSQALAKQLSRPTRKALGFFEQPAEPQDFGAELGDLPPQRLTSLTEPLVHGEQHGKSRLAQLRQFAKKCGEGAE